MLNILMQDGKESTHCDITLCGIREARYKRSRGSFVILLAWSWRRLDSDSDAGKGDVVDKQVKRDAHVIESGSEPDELHQAANDRNLLVLKMEDDEAKSEDSSYGRVGYVIEEHHHSW